MSLHNILSVAKYESRLLRRGWFFKIFTVLSLIPICFINFILYRDGNMWINALPSNIPYINLLMMNVGQAIIAIFLASDFIKRDTKLDTSEVFFVKPMSNTEYVLGKTWGNLKMFIFLNFTVLLISFIHNAKLENSWYDWQAYLFYFLTISIPTLIYIIGLSYFLMIFFKNQAIVFALLLAYIALTLFYINDSYYYIFDYIGFSLPLMKSDIIGFNNLSVIIFHRLIYVFLGFAFIAFTIYKLPRLANNKKKRKYTLAFTVIFFFIAGTMIVNHISQFYFKKNLREEFILVNNKYSSYSRILPDSCFIALTQNPKSIEAEVYITGKPQNKASEFVFSLNPSLKINDVTSESHEIDFEREMQAILIKFNREVDENEEVNLRFKYSGIIDESYCYLDIENKELDKSKSQVLFNIDKSYAFITPNYVLLTPESGWYPRQGVTYTPESTDWLQTYFTKFKMEISPLDSLVAVSQGNDTIVDGKYIFEPEQRLQSVTVAIGNYEKISTTADGIDYNLWMIKGHDYFTQFCDTLKDTIPFMLSDMKTDMERNRNLSYPFKRFGIIETPVHFASYSRIWTRAQETMQPELCLFSERGYNIWDAHIKGSFNNRKQWNGKWGNPERSDYELKYICVNNFIRYFGRQEGETQWSMKAGGNYNLKTIDNPYCIYPQLFNFKLNIYSKELSIANRLIEQYVDPQRTKKWIRNVNGISSQEKANMLLQKSSFKDLITGEKNNDLKNEIIGLKSQELFMPGELMIGKDEFKDSVFAFINNNSFRNVEFESMLKHFEKITEWDFKTDYSLWIDSVNCPGYEISEPKISHFPDEETYKYETTFRIKNVSNTFGLICIEIREPQNKKTYDYFYIDEGNTIERVILTEERPNGFEIDTNISTNIPSILNFRTSRVDKVLDRKPREADTYNIDDFEIPGEIIVDNEDPGFSVSENEPIGLLASWILKEEDEVGFEYVGYNPWRAPLKWSITTAPRYYGKNVRSVHFVKSGKGNGWAKWNVDIEEEGQYDLYYWVAGYEELRHLWWGDKKYQFFVNSGGEEEEYLLNLRNKDMGWALLGTFYINKGEFEVKLTNKTNMRCIEADAVKLVKR